ncbi:hypothetical protein F4818DRAFT_440661 [Hypoxylon cercidicola]|nr:hypothetical protein F4818DRAFT_440661 [Hypoxylon cercidicola]
MQSRWLLAAFSVAGASLAAASDPLGVWSVSDMHRAKSADGTLCDWHFTVTDSRPIANYSASGPGSTFVCEFNVTAPSGQDCGASPFSSYPCSGNSQYTINGGHSNEGFVVITLLNAVKRTQAFFGFLDSDLDAAADIEKQTRPVYHEFKSGKMEARQTEGGDSTPTGNWTVQDMFRDVDVQKHTVTIGFHILDGTSDGAHCMLVLTPPEGVDMDTWEWYNKQCEESGYYASWGYMAGQDAGIMTLVNPDRNSEAFFGFPSISSSAYLGNAGPNPVISCNCG